jgi:hypothetical protein
MYKPIQYGVSQSGITDQIVPLAHRELACDQSRSHGMPILKDLQEVMTSLISHFGKTPVIKEQKFCLGIVSKEFSVSSISLGNMKLLKDPWYPEILNRITLPAGLLSQSTREKGLSGSGRSRNQKIELILNPVTGKEFAHQ